ncbi:MAG: hypothetical protein L0H63_09770 [Nitrococcus sp.]|nr:hypothetical protein [Nitrococcus sp.]
MTRWCRQGRPSHIGVAVLSSTLLMLSGCADSRVYLSFLNPQGPVAAAERWHFIEVVLILGVFVALPIFVLTPWLAWRYRYGAKSSRYTPKWKDLLPLEIMTWVGPIVIVAVLGFELWRFAYALDPYKPIAPNTPALQVQVIGYDWKWLFIYPDQGIASIGEMAIPVGKPVAMHLTSATVMQSLQIPALVGQIYAMGGMVTQLHLKATKPGRSLGENTMYNGMGFHRQKFTAVAMPPDEFKAWVRKVRAIGVPLDARTYEALSQRSTRGKLAAALPRASHDGNVYLTGVSAALFSAVVEATMTGTPVALAHVLMAPAGSPAPVVRNTAASSMEKAP